MTENEKINLLPEDARKNILAMMKLKPDVLPDQPKENTWYTYYPEGGICSNGTPYKGTLKIGTENKLMILFCGGGTAVDEYCAARPDKPVPEPGKDTFYISDTDVLGYFFGRSGLANRGIEGNPYKDWSVVVITYATGDFHCGTNDFCFSDDEMGEGVCRHRGYFNYCAMLNKMQEYVPHPEQVFITGFSAGGFGAAILAGDIIRRFQDCNDFYCLVDSAALEYGGWRETAEKQWKAPGEICDMLVSDNLLADCAIAAYRKYGQKLKLAFTCTYRDALLANAQSYLDMKRLSVSKERGDRIRQILKKTFEILHKEIPEMSFYFYDREHPEYKDMGLTQHTIISDKELFACSYGGVRLIDWIVNTQKGEIQNVGLDLLDK